MRWWACILLITSSWIGAAPITLNKDDVVAFVGGTDMVRLQQDGRMEAALTDQYRAHAPRFRNLAWEGDTVDFQSTVRVRWRKEAFGDWAKQLESHEVTVVIVQFGKMEALAGVDRLDDFIEAYGKLIDGFGAERRVILIEPMAPEWEHADASALPDYVRAIREMALRRELRYVSLKQLGALQKQAPDALTLAVREKHRLWYDYWRPANWKCLFGDDSKRIFANAAEGLPSFKEEWQTFPALIAEAEAMVLRGEMPQPRKAPALHGSGEADIEAELAAFEVLDGYEVNLFADERMGIANPLAVRWDADGRMFVACSDVYPQIEPGVRPDDKLIALRDLDGDGAADESFVFARGLNIPTGLEVGGDGIYIGQNTQLLHINWQGKKKLLLSGFGNGDSHQTSNGFAWSPDGELLFSQGDGIESRVETPFGVSSLYQAGCYRLRPGSLRLDPLLDDFMGPGNPWGIAFDDFGQSFVIDGAGGISHLTPASIPSKRRLRLPRIGNPGGYCGVDALGDGSFGLGDYKKNQVTRFRTPEDGAGFKVEFIEPLLRSSHRNFRPIDVKLGPDGAIYVVDWYNPITCHQDDFYRHPARDKTHGRIWRVARKGAAAKVEKLSEFSDQQLVNALRDDNRWLRTKAKQVLATRGLKEFPAEVTEWQDRDLLEALGASVWCGLQRLDLVEKAFADANPRVRAYAARIAGRSGNQELLLQAAADPHPRVRMEAVLAAGQLPKAESVLVAAAVAERDRDRWITYAFKQAVHHLRPQWIPAFKRGELDFSAYPNGLAAVLAESDSKELLASVRTLLRDGTLRGGNRAALANVLLAKGEQAEDVSLALRVPNASLLRMLAERPPPTLDVSADLLRATASADEATQLAAWDLVRVWKVEALQKPARAAAIGAGTGTDLRTAAAKAYAVLAGAESMPLLSQWVGLQGQDPSAYAAILEIDPLQAAKLAADRLQRIRHARVVPKIFAHFVAKEGAGKLLAEQLLARPIGSRQAQMMRDYWAASGLVNDPLSRALDELAEANTTAFPYGEDLIAELVAAAKDGDPAKGKAHFQSAAMACAACHQVGDAGGAGGAIGPDLSAVGSGVPPERIVTEVLWPAQQIKDGYELHVFTRKDGSVLQGYPQKRHNSEIITVRDFASSAVHEIPKSDLTKREKVGTLMPPTAQGLSREELADLLAYLFGLSGG